MADEDLATTGVSPALAARAAGIDQPSIDALFTQLAVALLDIDRSDIARSLIEPVNMLREATRCDAVFIALLDRDEQCFGEVVAATDNFVRVRPQVLQGKSFEAWPGLIARLGELRAVGFTDTSTYRGPMQAAAAELSRVHVGSCLMSGACSAPDDKDVPCAVIGLINEAPCDRWSMDLTLLLKLLAANLGAGLRHIKFEMDIDALSERDGLLRETMNDGTWDFDGDSKRIEFSPRWKAMLGYEPDEEVAPDWYRLVHPEDMSAVQSKMREHLEGRTPVFQSIHRMRHRNGDWHWVESRAKAVTDERGRLLRLMGNELDINERKLYEEALFREKESAQITLQSIGDGVITTDENYIVEYINPVAEELTGWKVDDATGRPLDEIFRSFHEETCEPLENPLAIAVRRSRSVKTNRPFNIPNRASSDAYPLDGNRCTCTTSLAEKRLVCLNN